jgi:hypothetical protein
LFQKIAAGASGLIVTMTHSKIARVGRSFFMIGERAAALAEKAYHPLLWANVLRHDRWTNRSTIRKVHRSSVALQPKRQVEIGHLGETSGKETVAANCRTKLYDGRFALAAERNSVSRGDGMFWKVVKAIGALSLAFGIFAVEAPAHAQAVKAGVLTCNVASGFGFIFGSSRAINCTFSPGGAPPQHYTGAINKFGVDIGYVQGAVIVWAVLAPTSNPGPGSLAGTYVGATGSATVGVGIGANVLVGGSGNSVSLQPLSIEGNTGLNVAGGIAELSLSYQPG